MDLTKASKPSLDEPLLQLTDEALATLEYHYAPHSRQIIRYRGGGESFPATQQYYERVNTHAAGTTFDFSNCGMQDVSKLVVGMDDYGAVKVRISKGFAFANRKAAKEFEQQRSAFFQQHEARDEFMEMREGLDLLESEFVDYVLTYRNKAGPPWYVYPVLYWVASAFLLSWPLRVLIEYETAFLDLSIIKLFGVNYFGAGSADPSPRGSVAIGNSNSLTVPIDVEDRTNAAVRRLSQLHLAHLTLTAANHSHSNKDGRKLSAKVAPTTPTTIAENIDELSDSGTENGGPSFVVEDAKKSQYYFSHSYTLRDDEQNDKRAFSINNANVESGGSLKDRIERPMRATATRLGLGGQQHRRREWSSADGGGESADDAANFRCGGGERSSNQQSSAEQWRHGIVARGTLKRHSPESMLVDEAHQAAGNDSPRNNVVEDGGKQQSRSKKKRHKKKLAAAAPPSYHTALETSKPIVLPRSQAERLMRSPATPKNELRGETGFAANALQQQQPLLLSPPNVYGMPTPSTSSSRRVSTASHVIVVPVHGEMTVNNGIFLLPNAAAVADNQALEHQRRRSTALAAHHLPTVHSLSVADSGQQPRRLSRQHETTI